MNIVTSVKLEIYKSKHTRCWFFHAIAVVITTFFMGAYFVLYDSKEIMSRVKLIYELMGIYIPVFCAVSVAFLLRKEEQIANLYSILAVVNRKKAIGGILLLGWFVLFVQIIFLAGMLMLLGAGGAFNINIMWSLFGGMIVWSAFYYLIHMFINLKWGIGASLMCGVFECMQAIIYSNIELAKVFRYIPFSWLMEWKSSVLNGTLVGQKSEWLLNLVILFLSLFLFLQWFERWEGKKNHGE